MEIECLLSAPRPTALSPDVSYDEYAEIPAIRSGVVKDGLVQDAGRQPIVSPAHIKHSFEGLLVKDSDSLDFGKAMHTILLEPHKFEHEYCAFDGRRDARTKAYQDFLAENAGKTVLKAHGDKSYAWCLRAAQELCKYDEVKPFTEAGAAEVTGQAVIDNIPVKARYDWLSQSKDAIVDIKTSMHIGPIEFWRSFHSFGYGIQLALYREVYRLITDNQLPCFIIAIENHPPFCCVVYEVPGELLDLQLHLVHRVTKAVGECLETGQWPTFARGEVQPLAVPDWAMEEVDVLDWSE